MGNEYFHFLSQKFDSKVQDLIKQKEFYPFEKFKEELPSKENFYSSLTNKKKLVI